MPEGEVGDDGAVDAGGVLGEDVGELLCVLAVAEGAEGESGEFGEDAGLPELVEHSVDAVGWFVDVLEGEDVS